MKKNLDTKEKLLHAAQDLMLTKGYSATTIDEICKVAEVTKGCFFHYFASKEELAKTVLHYFCKSSKEMAANASFIKEKDPLNRLYGYIDFVVESQQNCLSIKGCLLGNFAQELANTYPEICSVCSQYFDEWIEGFKAQLDEAKIFYQKQINSYDLALYFLVVIEGSIILAKAKQNPALISICVHHYKEYLKKLFS